MSEENSEEKQKSILGVAQDPFPLCPLCMYYEQLKGHRVRVEVGRDRFEGILVHVAYKLDHLMLVSTEKSWIEYQKTFRNEDLTHIPAQLIKAVTLLEDQVHTKIREERTV